MKIFGVILSLILSSSAFAQSSQDVLELKADMSEATYLASKTEENLGGYVSALEAMVVVHCAAEIGQDPYYRGDPKGEFCKKSIAKLLEIDGWNPTALCARDGFKQRTCYETNASQNFGWYDPVSLVWSSENRTGSGKVSGFDTEAVIAMKSVQKRVGELKNKMFGIETWIRNGRKDPRVGAEMMKAAEEGMRLTCGYPKTIVRAPQAAAQPTPEFSIVGMAGSSSSEAGKPSSTSPIADVLDRLNAALPSPSPTPEPLLLKGTNYQRFRLLPTPCTEFISRALLIEPMAATPICYREGTFSPNCVAAKAVRKLTPGKPVKAPSSGSGFSTF